MKLIALAVALFSFSSMAATLDCRENHGQIYKIVWDEYGMVKEMHINQMIVPARGLYDAGNRWVYISAETHEDVYEISYQMDLEFAEHRFTEVMLTSYYGGKRSILCRYQK